ncbi:MAG: hypothetical protein SF187_24635 [Deltaproteobacteria bacterium]|nr:hypothetical protein [Deltaproteobacteria bacterium]
MRRRIDLGTVLLVSNASEDLERLWSLKMKGHFVSHAHFSDLPPSMASSPVEAVVAFMRDEQDLSQLGRLVGSLCALGEPELALICNGQAPSVELALRSVGFSNVVAYDSLAMEGFVDALIRKCLGRRLQAIAQKELEAHFGRADASSSAGKPLFVAESQFREAYLKALLAKSKTKRQAAEMAGLPYRTLCQMLATFRIGPGEC